MRAVLTVLLVACALFTAICNAQTPGPISIADDAGALRFGANADCNLFRSGAAQLTSDSSLTITQAISAGNIVTVPTTYMIGPTRQYTTLAQLWSQVLSKTMFSAPVTAQFDPGAYQVQPIVFRDAPTPHMISIIGNLLNPNSVVLNQAVAGNLFTFDGPGGSGMTLGGFIINGITSSAGIAILVQNGCSLSIQPAPGAGYLQSVGASLIINTFFYGMFAQSGSTITANWCCRFNSIANGAIVALYQSGCYTVGNTIVGPATYGMWAQFGSYIYAPYSTLTGLSVGVLCNGGSWMSYLGGTTVTSTPTPYVGCGSGINYVN